MTASVFCSCLAKSAFFSALCCLLFFASSLAFRSADKFISPRDLRSLGDGLPKLITRGDSGGGIDEGDSELKSERSARFEGVVSNADESAFRLRFPRPEGFVGRLVPERTKLGACPWSGQQHILAV